jgi:manganese efflux pump family protein
MSFLNIIGLSVGLAMDAVAVAIATGLGLPAITRRHVFRLGFHFGLFQFLMPVLGWVLGRQMAGSIKGCDHWVAFALLSFIGVKMLREARAGKDSAIAVDPTRGWTLVVLSVATSIDALAVGVSMAILRVPVWFPAVVIGVITATLTALGITFASRLGRRCGAWAGMAGGVVLILIGVRIVLSH